MNTLDIATRAEVNELTRLFAAAIAARNVARRDRRFSAAIRQRNARDAFIGALRTITTAHGLDEHAVAFGWDKVGKRGHLVRSGERPELENVVWVDYGTAEMTGSV